VLVDAKEVLILSGRRLGASLAEMSDLLGINASTVSRRYDSAKRRIADDDRMSRLVAKLIKQYQRNRD
jgi:DNA-directed RNA polymerase specialized sigma24 family protein